MSNPVGVIDNWNNLGITGVITPAGVLTDSLWAASLRTGPNSPPSTASSPGFPGEIIVAPGFLYVCVAQNEWERVALATW